MSMDAKGRLAIPARYRDRLAESCGGKLIATVRVDIRLGPGDALLQTLALDQLHGHVGDAVGDAGVMDSVDARVFQFGGNFGLAANRLERWDEAERAFGRAAELNPARTESRLNHGIALYQLKRWNIILDHQ